MIRLQIIVNSKINVSSNVLNFNNNVNQRCFFQSRSNSLNKFNNINRFNKTQFIYQINIENKLFEQLANQLKNKENSHYDENNNWIDEKKLKEFWYNEYDVNFVIIVDIITIIYICQLYVVSFSLKNKLFIHFRDEYWKRFFQYEWRHDKLCDFDKIAKINKINRHVRQWKRLSFSWILLYDRQIKIYK